MDHNFDPELMPFVEFGRRDGPVDLGAMREGSQLMATMALASTDLTGVHTEDHIVPGPADAPNLSVRIYAPTQAGDGPHPAMLYLHGGGFVLGSIAMEHAQTTSLARGVGAVVVSVEYRLAPEHPFPAAVDDAYAALVWLHGHAASLGVDPTRIAVVGNSAGAGLAAALTLMARDRGGPPIRFQYLGIPVLDDRLTTHSMTTMVDTPMWSRPLAELSWGWYLGEQREDVSAYAAPARAADLSGLPPAYVSTMESDPLRDEGILYAIRLLQAKVSTELHSFPGTWHGSRRFPSAITDREVAEMTVVLRAALHASAVERPTA